METLQKIFDSQIQEALSFKKIVTQIIAKKLKARGIKLNEKQLAKIESQLDQVDGDEVTIKFDENALEFSKSAPLLDFQNLQISLTEKNVDRFVSSFLKKIPRIMPPIVRESSQILLKRLEQSGLSVMKMHRRELAAFEARLWGTWGKALNLLEIFLGVCLEVGSDFNKEFRAAAAKEKGYTFEVLTRLHARACQIGSEVLCLLKSGFADGAHARWRTLHEVTIVALFVKQHGHAVAERYLYHEAVEAYRAAQQYQVHCEALGYEPLSEHELAETYLQYEETVKRFGPSFKRGYGWASEALGIADPKFSQIERAVGLDHWRPYYQLASHNVHPNPKGVFFKLGLSGSENLLLAGPSDFGLADPGHGTAISLLDITSALLLTRPNIDRLTICRMLMKLERDIGKAFIAAHRKCERRASRISSQS